MTELRRLILATVTVVAIGAAATGCGVSTSGPVDLGDGRVAGAINNGRDEGPPTPNEARSAGDLVSSFFKAAVESGSGQPLQRVRSFLTSDANAKLVVDPNNRPSPTVIRLLGAPVVGSSNSDGRVVTVHYVVVGVLNDQGRVEDLGDPTDKVMTFQVTPAEENARNIRIDSITDPAANVMISDEALNEFYAIQPVYFWDATNSKLIPDIRYVSRALAPDARAGRIVQWLVDGPSAWLAGAQRLPSGVAVKPSVQVRDGSVVVNLTSNAALGGDAAIGRLYHQLQWSLQDNGTPARVTLEIEDKPQAVNGGPTDYLVFNESYTVPSRGVRYDIVDGKVVPVVPPPKLPAVLAAKENQSILYAAVNRTASLAAVVKPGPDGRRSLQIIRDGAATVSVDFPSRSVDAGRPIWVTADRLMIPYGGRLYSVASNDSHPIDITPSRVGRVRAVSVSPDARRLALVADSQAYVTSLNLGDNPALTVGSNPRPLLAGQVEARSVAWVSEGWLYVAGASALWQVTADGVIAVNQSAALVGVNPTDVVAFPAPFSFESAEVDVYAGTAIYPFQTRISQVTQDTRLKAPFFGQ